MSVVTTHREGDLALVAINNPPVNAASHAVREGLLAAITGLDGEPAIKAIALYGLGRTFIAGADIREFGQTPQAPLLPDVCNAIEACDTPVVCVIHGTALGGGFEVALAAHARVALTGASVGLPEVTLGILPGAGGTQRTPRLAGVEAALDLITTAKRLSATEAQTLGLIDQIIDGTPEAVAREAAAALRDGTLPHRRTGALTVAADEAALAATRARLATTAAHLFSPHKAVEAVAASVRPIAEGLATERALFNDCLASPQRAGLIHAFFAERAVAKIPEKDATPRPVETVGVIGAGTMGSGIATALLLAGKAVTLVEREADALDRGRATIAKNLDGAQTRGKLSPDRRAAVDAALTGATSMDALRSADLIIEAAFEDFGVKAEIFKTLDQVAKPGAILATNTSYLDVDAIAAVTQRPQDVLGLHFFSPAHVMRLVEVVAGDKTAPEVVATGFALAKALRKIAVRSGVCDGFIGNRILSHYRKAAEYLVLDGASPEAVDTALEAYGFAMGPHRVFDLAGLDIAWAQRKRLAATRPAAERYVRVADRLCEAGAFGRKTGAGFYTYGDGAPTPNPKALAVIEAERAENGITPRAFSDDEILSRYLTAMISEAVRVVADGTALRPIDVDAVLLFGYGFPRHRGGPLHEADQIGAATLVSRIEQYAAEDPHYWQVPPLLRTMAADGTTFADRNGG
ncbi:MAG: 3-hydroxyacyl-CoA dehydrogenase NAD-binding domain-containing protein [Pseudomonadota bacterium]